MRLVISQTVTDIVLLIFEVPSYTIKLVVRADATAAFAITLTLQKSFVDPVSMTEVSC
jgi:hypothetical protein